MIDINLSLCLTDGVGLIIQAETNIMWHNQAAGAHCMQCRAEGFFVPIDNEWREGEEENSLFSQLRVLFYQTAYLDGSIAERMDEILGSDWCTNWIKVDRSRLSDSFEAWVFVTLESKHTAPVSGLESSSGILVWRNSD